MEQNFSRICHRFRICDNFLVAYWSFSVAYADILHPPNAHMRLFLFSKRINIKCDRSNFPIFLKTLVCICRYHLFIHIYIHRYIYLSIYISVYLSIFLSFILPSFILFFCLSFHFMNVYVLIHLLSSYGYLGIYHYQ